MHITRLIHRWKSTAWREAKRLAATRRNQTIRLALLEQIRKLQDEIASMQKNSRMLSSSLEDIEECVYPFTRAAVFVLHCVRLCMCGLQYGPTRSQKTQTRT